MGNWYELKGDRYFVNGYTRSDGKGIPIKPDKDGNYNYDSKINYGINAQMNVRDPSTKGLKIKHYSTQYMPETNIDPNNPDSIDTDALMGAAFVDLQSNTSIKVEDFDKLYLPKGQTSAAYDVTGPDGTNDGWLSQAEIGNMTFFPDIFDKNKEKDIKIKKDAQGNITDIGVTKDIDGVVTEVGEENSKFMFDATKVDDNRKIAKFVHDKFKLGTAMKTFIDKLHQPFDKATVEPQTLHDPNSGQFTDPSLAEMNKDINVLEKQFADMQQINEFANKMQTGKLTNEDFAMMDKIAGVTGDPVKDVNNMVENTDKQTAYYMDREKALKEIKLLANKAFPDNYITEDDYKTYSELNYNVLNSSNAEEAADAYKKMKEFLNDKCAKRQEKQQALQEYAKTKPINVPDNTSAQADPIKLTLGKNKDENSLYDLVKKNWSKLSKEEITEKKLYKLTDQIAKDNNCSGIKDEKLHHLDAGYEFKVNIPDITKEMG